MFTTWFNLSFWNNGSPTSGLLFSSLAGINSNVERWGNQLVSQQIGWQKYNSASVDVLAFFRQYWGGSCPLFLCCLPFSWSVLFIFSLYSLNHMKQLVKRGIFKDIIFTLLKMWLNFDYVCVWLYVLRHFIFRNSWV